MGRSERSNISEPTLFSTWIPPVSVVESLTAPMISFFAGPLLPAREHLLSIFGLLKKPAILSENALLPPCGSMPHVFVEEEGPDGSARLERSWYREPPLIAYCIHTRRIGTNCIPWSNSIASNFSRVGTTGAGAVVYELLSPDGVEKRIPMDGRATPTGPSRSFPQPSR